MLPWYVDEQAESSEHTAATTPRARAEHRLLEAIEEVKMAAKVLNINPAELTAPLSLRVDAWLWRSSRWIR